MTRLLIALALLAAVGCSKRQIMAGEPAPPDDVDQQGWADTSPYGSGEEVSGGYYGVSQAQSAQPERTAADPTPMRRSPWR